MTFLAVARLGKYTAAAQVLGVNHSTVSRRIAALEDAMGGHVLTRTAAGWEATLLGQRALAVAERIETDLAGLVTDDDTGLGGLVRIAAPDAFTALHLVPAIAPLQETHPGLAFELISATQRVRQHRSGVDIEIAVGRPHVRKALATPLLEYMLALYAAPEYLERHGAPASIAGLAHHRVAYYIDSALQVDELDAAGARLPEPAPSIRSTSVFAHLAAAQAGAGIGLLPDFLAAADPRLVRVLPDEYEHTLAYWAVTREEALRNPAVAAAFRAIVEHRPA
ncbi:LysR family transcriptional regulator [Agromyces archimandritae]|uniref:LysR family transcriptional regulator n=2 Tax=Agromyces archimandritae TaxID=2781962 RepID=A0A975FQD6_9MICO|nr:LysR family transcriptional regulator [Agromyces archimandritae]